MYRVNKVAKGLEPEAREAFLQKVYVLKQQFALDVDKLMQEVQSRPSLFVRLRDGLEEAAAFVKEVQK